MVNPTRILQMTGSKLISAAQDQPHAVQASAESQILNTDTYGSSDLQISEAFMSLPPRQCRYVTGVLTRVQDDRLVLGLAGYFAPGHRQIFKAMQSYFGPVSSLLWSGELLLSNPSDQSALGRIIRVNDTSGFYAEELKGLVCKPSYALENSNQNLLLALQGRPFVDSEIEMIQHGEGQAHLLSSFNLVKVEGLNFRHAISNILQDVSNPINFMVYCADETGLIQGMLLSKKENILLIKRYCESILETDEFDQDSLRELIGFLDLMSQGRILENDLAKIALKHFESLCAFVADKNCKSVIDLIRLN